MTVNFLTENFTLITVGVFIALLILIVIYLQDELRSNSARFRAKFGTLGKRQPRVLRSIGRLAAFLFLCFLTWMLGMIATNAYWAANDSWVAPVHFSPDSDEVIETHLRVHERLEKMSLLRSRLIVIDHDLKGNERGNAGGQKKPEHIRGFGGNIHAPPDKNQEEANDDYATNQPQFFTNDGKNEVGVPFGKNEKFLPALPQTQSPKASGPNGNQ